MIEIIEGRGVGAGKSYFAIEKAMLHWIQGGTCCLSDTIEVKWNDCKRYARDRAGVVLEDDQYRAISSEQLQNLHEFTPPGSPDLPVKIFVDEAQDAFNARDWSDKSKRPFFSWLCQSRHDDNDVIILSQAAANVDKQVRRLVTYYWVVRNTEFFPVGGKPLADWVRLFTFGLSDGRYFIRTQLDQDGKTSLSKAWKRGDKGLYRCYESKAMRLKHRRGGEAVARKKLERVKRKKPMFKYLFVIAIICALGGLFVLGKHGFMPKKAPVPAGAVAQVPASSSSSARVYRNGEVLREELRAFASGYLQTSVRTYVLGAVNDLGRVVWLKRGSGEVEVRKGVVVKIEAFEGHLSSASPTPSGFMAQK